MPHPARLRASLRFIPRQLNNLFALLMCVRVEEEEGEEEVVVVVIWQRQSPPPGVHAMS